MLRHAFQQPRLTLPRGGLARAWSGLRGALGVASAAPAAGPASGPGPAPACSASAAGCIRPSTAGTCSPCRPRWYYDAARSSAASSSSAARSHVNRGAHDPALAQLVGQPRLVEHPPKRRGELASGRLRVAQQSRVADDLRERRAVARRPPGLRTPSPRARHSRTPRTATDRVRACAAVEPDQLLVGHPSEELPPAPSARRIPAPATRNPHARRRGRLRPRARVLSRGSVEPRCKTYRPRSGAGPGPKPGASPG